MQLQFVTTYLEAQKQKSKFGEGPFFKHKLKILLNYKPKDLWDSLYLSIAEVFKRMLSCYLITLNWQWYEFTRYERDCIYSE